MRRARTLIVGAILGFFLGILLVFIVSRFQSHQKYGEGIQNWQEDQTLEIDSPAPGFELQSVNGESIRLKEFRGKVVLINFWASWCGPCRIEMPFFQSRFDAYPNELAILAINAQDNAETAAKFMKELGLTFEALMDPNGVVHKRYLVRGFPTSVFVDPDGILRYQHIGLMTEDQFDEYLAQIGLE